MQNKILYFLLVLLLIASGCSIKTTSREIVLLHSSKESAILPRKMIFSYYPPTYTIAVVSKSIEIQLDENGVGVVDFPLIDGWLRIDSSDDKSGTSLKKEDIINGGEFILYGPFNDPDKSIPNPSGYKVVISDLSLLKTQRKN
jgi:hypothetical protein